MPLSDAQKAYIATLKEVRAETARLQEEQARRDLWRGVDSAVLLHDAETARDEARAVREAREAARDQDFRIRALRAELGLDD